MTAVTDKGTTTLPASARPRGMLTLRRLAVTLLILCVVLAIICIAAIAIGSEHVAFVTTLKIIGSKIAGKPDATPVQQTIIAELRLPRVLLAVVVGAALSVAGAGYQALLRNPLADPAILGVSTGAAAGAIMATIFAVSFPVSRPIAAFLGALMTIGIVFALGQTKRGGSSERLILAGVITNAFLSSVVIFLVTTVSGTRLQSVISWLIGDLSGESQLLPPVAGFVAVGIVIVFLNARGLNLLMTGEDAARALGVEVGRTKLAVYLAASLITGAAVAVTGVIGFVGLIVPHAVRLLGGSDNRFVIPASALVGGSFLVLADLVARTVIAPREVHIGVITAIVGAPVFIYLLRRTS
jgi:ABC-type Fe3+-siderophore transport system permease subunit